MGVPSGCSLKCWRALVGEDVDGRVDGTGLGVLGDGEDGAGGVVAGGVVEGGGGIGGAFVDAGDVERGDGYVAGLRGVLAGVAAAHELQAALGEEAAVDVEGFEEVFAGDEGVLTAVFGDLGGEEALVVGVFGGDLVGADDEDALTAVLGL